MRVIVVLCLVAFVAAQYDYSVNTQQQAGGAQLSAPIQPADEYNKEFYTYSAPEHEFNHIQPHETVSTSVRKNLRVIFIKGPENTGLENAAVHLAKSTNDDRTAIYVLSKQADVGELANKLNSVQTSQISHKPEVHFIKYRTSADAENAQRAIQSQYDALPGSSSSHSGGSAPVLDFASKPAQAPAAQVGHGTQGTHAAPATSYAAPAASFAAPAASYGAPAASAAPIQNAAPAKNYVQPQSQTYLPPGRRL